jgi:hypothetical protein
MTTQYTLHAQVLELRALADDGRGVHVPVAINNSQLTAPEQALPLLERRIQQARAMAEAMLAARPAPEPDAEETKKAQRNADILAAMADGHRYDRAP